MSDQQESTLLFMARVEADEDTHDHRVIIEPDQEADAEAMGQLLYQAGNDGFPVEVHRDGTAAVMGEKDALLRAGDDILRANLEARREIGEAALAAMRQKDSLIAEVEAERDEARAELARGSTGVQLAPDAPEWVIAMLDKVAKGRDIRVELDNDGQKMCDWTDHDTMTKEQLEEYWLPVLEIPGSPREMVEDLFKALGVKAEGI